MRNTNGFLLFFAIMLAGLVGCSQQQPPPAPSSFQVTLDKHSTVFWGTWKHSDGGSISFSPKLVTASENEDGKTWVIGPNDDGTIRRNNQNYKILQNLRIEVVEANGKEYLFEDGYLCHEARDPRSYVIIWVSSGDSKKGDAPSSLRKISIKSSNELTLNGHVFRKQ